MGTKNFQMFKLDLEKAEEPEIKSPTSAGSQTMQENSRKTSTSASLTTLSLWLCGSQQTAANSSRDENSLPALPTSYETCMQVKKQQLEPNMEQQTGSKLGKEGIKAVYCHPVYLTSMQSTSCKILGWMNHRLELRLPGKISATSEMQMIPP